MIPARSSPRPDGVAFQEFLVTPSGERVFATRGRDGGRGVDLGIAVDVVGDHRLLDSLEVVLLQPAAHLLRVAHRAPHVGVSLHEWQGSDTNAVHRRGASRQRERVKPTNSESTPAVCDRSKSTGASRPPQPKRSVGEPRACSPLADERIRTTIGLRAGESVSNRDTGVTGTGCRDVPTERRRIDSGVPVRRTVVVLTERRESVAVPGFGRRCVRYCCRAAVGIGSSDDTEHGVGG